MKLAIALAVLLLPATHAFAIDAEDCPGFENFVREKGRCPEKAPAPETFGDTFYKSSGQIAPDSELVDTADCAGFEEYVRTHGHCPQKTAEPEAFGDAVYERTGQLNK